MRTSSIISDENLLTPEPVKQKKKPAEKPSDFERLALSSDYPEIAFHLQRRIDHYKAFTPTGAPIAGVPAEELPYRWGQAVSVIAELEALLLTFETFKEVGRAKKT